MTGTLFYSSLMTETNSFSSVPTSYASFEEEGILRGDAVLFDDDGKPKPSSVNVLNFAKTHNFSVVSGLSAAAEPGMPTDHNDYCFLRDEILDSLTAALPVNAVLLGLHGAMMSTENPDCEGDILRRVRDIVGPSVPVVSVLDPHAHLTDMMVDSADFLVFMKEYPHVDGLERTDEALAVIAGLIDGNLHLTLSVKDCELLGFYPTDDDPMRSFVDKLFELEKDSDVVSISFVHGFPWGDTHDVGSKVLVYTNDDQQKAATIAKQVSDEIWSIKDETMFDTVDVDQALALIDPNSSKPAVFGDIADNPGGGAAADSTFILQALIDAGIENVAIGLLFDPDSVARCHKAGVGKTIDLNIGGKLSRYSGAPVSVEATVRALAGDARMNVADIVDFAMGDTAWVTANGIDIVLMSVRIQTYSPDAFLHLGVDLAEKSAIFVKSTNHFRAFFGDLASDVYYVNTPGAINYDLAAIPYQVFSAPYYPRL